MRAARVSVRSLLLVAALGLGAAAVPGTASAGPKPGAPRRGFRLFARATGALTINRVACGLTSSGNICTDSTGSALTGGGFWPKGTADQYVFNSGLQLAGIIGPDGGPWAGDTVGGFLFDPKGTTVHGEEVEPIYNANLPADLASWPGAACVPRGDATADLFNPLLQSDPTAGDEVPGVTDCRKSASQGDVWFVSWEGNPALRAGRKHPLGIVVETRGMGWNFPAGNEDILYYVFTFYNVTSTNRADYGAIRPSLADILYQKALDFHAANAALGVSLPAGGYTINPLFAAFGTDMDVSTAGANYASVNLPFALGYTYDRSFAGAAGWTFDPSIFSAPFFAGSGFAGVKYLSSPTGAGEIQLYSNTINGRPFAGAVNDPRDVVQLYRYLSGTLSTNFGDDPCNTGAPAQTHICFINNNSPQDMRFFQSSTPLALGPGQGGSIVVAYIFAPPVVTGGCSANCDVKPGDPLRLTNATALATGGANLVDSLTGFLGYTDGTATRPADGIVQQEEFRVVPGSLLGKAKVAQAVFDGRFLLPFAPSTPEFFLIPGDNQVTVLWKPTASEASGDPYYALASQSVINGSANPLYDPNYRQFDVEGYRIYRGRVDAPNELTLLAQYDYAGTVISDYTGIVNADPACAPEFGITGSCATLAPNPKDGTTLVNHTDYDLVGDIVQVQAGAGRVHLANGTALNVAPDTAVIGGGKLGGCGPKSACPALSNTLVPFVYVDRTPRNNFRYFYSVTAFDVNSIESGPTSLESPRATKSVTPVAPAANAALVGNVVTHIYGRGVPMDSVFPNVPSLDPTTGEFSGPMPPANGVVLGFAGQFASKVVSAPGDLSLTLDSIGAGSAYDNTPTTYYMTAVSPDTTIHYAIPVVQDQFDGTNEDIQFFNAISADQSLAGRYGGDASFKLKAQITTDLPGNYYTNSWGRGCINGAAGFTTQDGCDYNGARWFKGPSPQQNENTPDPNAGNGPNGGSGVNAALPNNAGFNNAGSLPNVDVIHPVIAYQTTENVWRDVHGGFGSFVRAADYNVYWNATTAGLIDSVIDVTHNLVVPFDSLRMNASFGLLTAATAQPTAGSFDGRVEVSMADFTCVPPVRSEPAPQGRVPCTTATPYTLTRQAAIGPIVFFTGTNANVQTSTNTGQGFAMYLAGNTFLFQTTTLPSGTVWSMRDYVGGITGGNGFAGSEGPYTFFGVKRPFSAVGAQIRVSFVAQNALLSAKSSDLRQVHTVPDPYYVTDEFEQSTDNKVIKFVNLPAQAIIRIYSSSGVLVNVLEHNSTTFGGDETWNVRNRNNQVVASGVYFYHIEAQNARRVGRMTIVNFAQ
jgi:hypothetical protein